MPEFGIVQSRTIYRPFVLFSAAQRGLVRGLLADRGKAWKQEPGGQRPAQHTAVALHSFSPCCNNAFRLEAPEGTTGCPVHPQLRKLHLL
jgi:hypothetical protein